MQVEMTEREHRFMKAFQEHPSEFADSLLKVADLTEEEHRFIESFRENPELAIECLKKVLSERKEKQNTEEKGDSMKC